MSKTIFVKVEPAILKYARKCSGFDLDDVAKKIKISEEKLRGYEEEISDIPLSCLEKLTNIYKRPLAAFLLDKMPAELIEPKDFRVIYDSEEDRFSPDVMLAIRRSRYIQSVLEELSDVVYDYKFPDVLIKSNVDGLADWFESFLLVSQEEQKKWSNSAEALRGWKNALESKNIFVLQQSLSKDNISAFCLADKSPYVILLNSAEHETRRIFSLFHEVGHLLLHKSGICTPDDFSQNTYEYVQIEKFCNQFAASFILPKEKFLRNSEVSRLVGLAFDSWTDESLSKIASNFKISKEVVLRRFLTLGIIKENDYESRRREWLKKSLEYAVKKKKSAKIPQYIKTLSQNGRGVTSFVLDKYHSNKISFSAAAEILNVNPKHLSRVEANLR